MNRSYYEATIATRSVRPALDGSNQAEVCIVGAGFAGLATALGLLERGVTGVTVVEAEQVAFGASGRNGGFVFGGYSLDCAELLRQLGAEQARALYRLTRDALVLIRRRVERYGIDCSLVEGGALQVNWFDDESILRWQQALMAEAFDAHWQLIDKQALGNWVVSPRYHGALFEPDAFHFHPLAYALGIAAAIERLGGRIHERSRVTSVERQGAAYRVSTDAGHVEARHVVVAGGGYLRGVVPALERAMLPIATYIMVTEPLGDALARWIPSRAAIYDTRFAFDYYRALPDTRLLWGGRISIFDRDAGAIARFLKRDMTEVFPALRDARVDFAWSGMMSYARHKMPQVGALPDGVWYTLGFGGHGVAPTTVAGEQLAAAIADQSPLAAAFMHYGLAPALRPFGLAAAQCAYGWYRLRDALHGAFG